MLRELGLCLVALVVGACSSSDSGESGAGGEGGGAGFQGEGGSSGGSSTGGTGGGAGASGAGLGGAAGDAATIVPGFGTVEGECGTCLDESINNDGVCSAKYAACLADLGCSKLLVCYRDCAVVDPSTEAFCGCTSSVKGCEAGASDSQISMARQALNCVCCNIAACRSECKPECTGLNNGLCGPFSC